MEKGQVFNIQRFSTDDGPGIRTTVFLQGCPLRCYWCHNPEGLEPRHRLSKNMERCVGCGNCLQVCPKGAVEERDGIYTVNRENCIGCGLCESVCSYGALSVYGREMTATEVIEQVMQDSLFYGEDGGITISGGEPLLQADFACEVLRMAKLRGITTAVETSGFGSFEQLERLSEVTDLFLYDVKCVTQSLHRKGTGQSNRLILENLKKLSEKGASILVRIPVIPSFNDSFLEFDKIFDYLKEIPGIRKVHLMPFHRLAADKYEHLGKEYAAKNLCLDREFFDAMKLRAEAFSKEREKEQWR